MSDERIMGPALPPHLLKKPESKKIIGPSLPPHLLQKSTEEEEEEQPIDAPSDSVPEAVSSPDEDIGEDTYGPVLPGTGQGSKTQIALEERALQYKIDQLTPGENLPTREEWMVELPEAAAKFGLGPRQFRAKAGPDLSDRSSWTDTPDKKASTSKPIDLKKEAEIKEIQRRDKEQEKVAKKHKTKKESLVEMHEKSKKQKKEESTERRPFNRETDLQVNRFDEAQRKAVLKKAQLLDDRFSRGQSKYL